METPGEIITAAAQMLRYQAQRAMPALRWHAEQGVVTAGPDGHTVAEAPDSDREQAAIDTRYMALVDPAVGLALADLLDRQVRSASSPTDLQSALAVAEKLFRQE